jgi:hypothetical protein
MFWLFKRLMLIWFYAKSDTLSAVAATCADVIKFGLTEPERSQAIQWFFEQTDVYLEDE